VPGCNILGATVHDIELLATLVGAGVGVRVAIDALDRPHGVLELHLLLLIALGGNLLLALPLSGRHSITARLLLLLLPELLRELFDLPALLSIVALGVMYRAPRAALITTRGLPRLLAACGPWPPPVAAAAAAALGGLASDFLLLLLPPPAFFFFFLPLL
jgi:hypothetical protein